MASTFRERRFPPSEVRRILRSAARIAETDPGTGAVERPLTQDEITRWAAELGLPASAVSQAIGAPEAPEPAGAGPWLGARTVALEQVISGELPPERHEDVVTAIRSAAGVDGRTEVLGKTLSWSANPATKNVVTVRSKEGKTEVRVEEALNGTLLLSLLSIMGIFPALMGGAVAMDVSRSGPHALAAGAVFFLASLVAAAFWTRRTIRRREAFLHRLMERTTSAVFSAVEKPAAANTARRPATAPARIADAPAGKRIAATGPGAIDEAAEAEAAEEEAASGSAGIAHRSETK